MASKEVLDGDEAKEYFLDQTLAVVGSLLAEGYKSPFYMAMIGTDGAMGYSLFVIADDGTPMHKALASYKGNFRFPIHQLWIDATGAAKIVEIGMDDNGRLTSAMGPPRTYEN